MCKAIKITRRESMSTHAEGAALGSVCDDDARAPYAVDAMLSHFQLFFLSGLGIVHNTWWVTRGTRIAEAESVTLKWDIRYIHVGATDLHRSMMDRSCSPPRIIRRLTDRNNTPEPFVSATSISPRIL